jgi:hypothetical protein
VGVETVTPANAAEAHKANRHTITNTDFGINRFSKIWFLAFDLPHSVYNWPRNLQLTRP